MEFLRRRISGVILAIAGSLALSSCVTVPEAPVPARAGEAAEADASAPARRDVQPLIAEALAALEAHASHVPHHDKIGVADFSLPSREPRFFLVDVASGRIERSWLVAHGSGSDPNATGMVERFSNRLGSNASSRGAYLTANTYVGKHGPSQRLIGLDPDNDSALDRAIVIHGADYVDPALVASQGRIGRSQGCFAFEAREVAEVMSKLGEGRLIYAGRPT